MRSDDRKDVPIVLVGARVAAHSETAKSGISDITSEAGSYVLDLKRNRNYFITISREGYNSKTIRISSRGLPKLVNKSHVELADLDILLLKSDAFPDDISLKEDVGTISYDPNRKEFRLNVNRDYRQAKQHHDNTIKYVHKSSTYLDDVDMRTSEASSEKKKGSISSKLSKGDKETQKLVTDAMERMPEIESTILDNVVSKDTASYDEMDEIQTRRKALDSARKAIRDMWANAKTREDSLEIMRLEAKIDAAESGLARAEETIKRQEAEIGAQKARNTLYIISILLLLAIAGVIFYFYRDKIRINRELAEKNQLILDGITYANTIQSSFLKTEEEIQKVLPNFVLFFRPRDIVSGDIYWVSKVDSKTVVAAIDCTGHGVPGAFISMIANTLLNEIVNNKKILDPGSILNALHEGVVDALLQKESDSNSQDGMDMSLLIIDESSKKMQFAGAKNHMYKVSDGELEVVKADLHSIGGRSMRSKDGFKKDFNTANVSYETGSVYYLFSDGFMDQFGGPEEKKFNLPNFQELLVKAAGLDMQDQKKLLDKAFDDWRGDQQQLDDVLVFGFKV